MDYSKFLNSVSSARQENIIVKLKFASDLPPDTIFLAAGNPSSDNYPFSRLTFDLEDGTRFTMEEEELRRILEYQHPKGNASFLAFLKEFNHDIHAPPKQTEDNSEILVTTGSQDALCKCVEMMLDFGDAIVAESFAYTGTVISMLPFRPDLILIDADKDGMRSDLLALALAERSKAGKKPPKFLYINPTGSNPTGTVLSLQRRQEIYQICSEHDLIILEDDPYYFLTFDDTERLPSFYSMDKDGRVIRFDSFSKIVAPGLRLAFATGPKPLMDKFLLHCQASVQHSSSLTQTMVEKLLRHWGWDGFWSHIRTLQDYYQSRRDVMVAAAQRHLNGLCLWNVPAGGMFMWFRICDIEDSWDFAKTKMKENSVLLVPGKAFTLQPEIPCPYLRASFGDVKVEDVDLAFARLAKAIRDYKQK